MNGETRPVVPANTLAARRWAVVPPLVVTLPLVGHSLLGDDRRRLYSAARQVGSNPFEALDQSWRNVSGFLDRGNFRPLGRAVERFERAVVFDVGEATGLPAHAVNGASRVLLIAVLAVVSFGVMSAVLRSAGLGWAAGHPAAVLYPMVLAVLLVAGDHYSPLTSYTLVLTGSVIVILATGLWVARDRDMAARPLSWHEPVVMIALGAVLAATYDLAYLAPPFAGAFVTARVLAYFRPCTLRQFVRLASVRRWLLLCAGFAAVFVPVRIEIARRCARSSCYVATDADVTVDALGRTADRLATGLPPAGWSHAGNLLERAGVRFGLADLGRNVLLVALLAAVCWVVFASARRARRAMPEPDAPAVGWQRTAMVLAGLGLVTALMPSLLVGLSKRTQSVRPAVGEAWRETAMVQVGWSMVAAGLLVAVFGAVARTRSARAVPGLAALLLGVGMALTLHANAGLVQADRATPLHAITAEMATAAIHFDQTDGGNRRRCGLVDDYTAILPDPQQWVSGPNVGAELDGLMMSLHDLPFCNPEHLDSAASHVR